jgi:polyisoprenoid-binding protein YceI
MMQRWIFEPGHCAAEFCARHMMVTHVRGHFKNIRGFLDYDPSDPRSASVEATIDARELWTGERDRDAHLRSPEFLDVERFAEITFRSERVALLGDRDYVVTSGLTLRGVTKEVRLRVSSLGQWQTPWWEGGVDRGPRTRAGFLAHASINRHDFGVSWNASLDRGGVVVGEVVEITIDVEAILES